MEEKPVRNSTFANLDKARCFSAKAAMEVEAAVSQDGRHTVKLQIAPKGMGDRYDWKKGPIIQPDNTELVQLIALFLGLGPKAVKLARDEKSIEFERQQEKIYAKATRKEGIYSLPITPGDSVVVASLMMSQFKRQCFGIDGGLLMMAIKSALQLYQK